MTYSFFGPEIKDGVAEATIKSLHELAVRLGEEKRCPACSDYQLPDAIYCNQCGAAFSSDTASMSSLIASSSAGCPTTPLDTREQR